MFWFTWRNPFALTFYLIVLSAIAAGMFFDFDLPLFVRVPIYFVWTCATALTAVCVAAVISEERPRLRR